jgi:spore germination protein GerM
MLRREREANKAKREKQRKLDGELRKQTVKQRNKLYHLISTGKITKIFANKAGHVLAEGQGIQWGDEADADEAEAFMEDSTQATSSDESSDESDMAKRKKKIAQKAEKKAQKEQEAHEEAERKEAEEKLKNGGSDKSTPRAGSGDAKEEEKPKSFFSFLFRNRDTNAPPSP